LAFLQIFVGDEFYLVLKISPAKPPELTWHNQSQLHELFAAMREYLQLYELSLLDWHAALPRSLRRMERALLLNERVPDLEEGVEQIVIIPHRLTRLIPFGALRVRGEYLQDYCPQGIQTLLNGGPLMRGSSGPASFQRAVAILNPTDNLPSAAGERATLESTYRSTFPVEGAAASWLGLLRARSQIEAADCLHFCCHGSHDPGFNWNGKLNLAAGSFLDLHRMREHRLDLSHFYPKLKTLGQTPGQNWPQTVAGAMVHAQRKLRLTSVSECEAFIAAMKIAEAEKEKYRHDVRRRSQSAIFDDPYYWAPFCALYR
jgi:CHAT domain-containing protein